MSSRIEQMIDDIEDYVESCKFKALSSTVILVNKEEILDLIQELRSKTPDEIKRYQRIIQNKEAILDEARKKAEKLINEATIQTTELISEHEIMQQAYAQAGEVLTKAQAQAKEILDSAMMEANGMKVSAVEYTDSLLAYVEGMIEQTVALSVSTHEELVGGMKQYQEIIRSNRKELSLSGQDVDVDAFDYDEPIDEDDDSKEVNLDLI